MFLKATAVALATTLTVAATTAPAAAQWRRHHWHGHHHHHHHGGWGAPLAGFAAGALLGSALAAPRYYAPAPVYGPPIVEDDSIAYCQSRYRSYDVASGTYLGYDGLRHPCP